MTPVLAAVAAPLDLPVTFGFVALVVGVAAVGIAGFLAAVKCFLDPARPLLGSLSLLAFAAALCAPAYLPQLPIAPGVNHERVADLVSERYVIEGVANVDDAGPGGELCESVTGASPLYAGVVDGQQVEFRVGVPDCAAENPVAEIAVTSAPGRSLSAGDLERTPAP